MPNGNINRKVTIGSLAQEAPPATDVTLYYTDWSTGTPDTFPAGWTRFVDGGSGNDADCFTTNSPTTMASPAPPDSTGYAGASGGYALLIPNIDGVGSLCSMTLSGQVSTIGYENIRVSFGYVCVDFISFPSYAIHVYFSWSADGVTWNDVSIYPGDYFFPDFDSVWQECFITLDASTENISNLRIKIEYNPSENAFTSQYALDDLKIIGDEI